MAPTTREKRPSGATDLTPEPLACRKWPLRRARGDHPGRSTRHCNARLPQMTAPRTRDDHTRQPTRPRNSSVAAGGPHDAREATIRGNRRDTETTAAASFSTDRGCRTVTPLRQCNLSGVRAAPLPDELPESFSVGTAMRLGVSRRRLRASDLSSPFYGVRTRSIPAEDMFEASVRRRSAEYAARMRDCEFFCLVAAAVVWGAPLPSSVFRIRDGPNPLVERPLDVGVLLPSRASRARGVRGISIAAGMGSVRTEPASGLRATSPATTWAMMGALLQRDDLVALGDAFVREPMRSGDPPALRRSPSSPLPSRRGAGEAPPRCAKRCPSCVHARGRGKRPRRGWCSWPRGFLSRR